MLLDKHTAEDAKHDSEVLERLEAEATRRRIDRRCFRQSVRAALDFFRAGTSPDPEDVAMARAARRNIPDPGGILAQIPGFLERRELQLRKEDATEDAALKKQKTVQ